MTNLLQQAINSDDVANYRFPKSWPENRELRAESSASG
jgi:hypothetical protein